MINKILRSVKLRIGLDVLTTALICSFFILSPAVLADATSVLRPTADGGEDSADWKNTVGTACNGVSCYLEVDESSGSSCTNSDGDTSYVESATNGTKQTFDIDESGIPDNSTITQISITVCHKDISPLLTSTFKTRRCIDGTCTSFGTNITTGSSYAETTQDHSGLSITKTSATDIEIGVHVANAAAAGGPRVSQVSAVITYTLPAPPPPPPPPGDGAEVETLKGVGGNVPARVIFSGEAYPDSVLGIYLIGNEYGKVLIQEVKVGSDGEFLAEIISPVQEKRVYALLITDKDGNAGKSKFFTYDLKFNTVIRQKDIIFPPFVMINKSLLSRGELLLISGSATPGNIVKAFDGLKLLGQKTVGGDGRYEILVDTGTLPLGPYTIHTRQFDPESAKDSDVSESRLIKVVTVSYVNIDFNSDAKVDIQDWSVFLSNWSSGEQSARLRDDLNGDGKVDVSDFAVFLRSFQLVRSGSGV